ncbi:MAG: hypothetical protein H6581_25285 [Bacteroidia bacterium]|nr:hypothetical protein [Bacteroidia bacterium]
MLFSCLAVLSCQNQNEISGLPTSQPASSVKVSGLIFQAASSSGAAAISVQDRFPAPMGDGENEIWIPRSGSESDPDSLAEILVDPRKFPQGVSSLDITCAHFKSCILQAVDLKGNPIGAERVHDKGENTEETFHFSGQGIGGIEIRGAEISIISAHAAP